jgi:hypothetical protein
MKFKDSEVPAKTAGHMDSLVKEAIAITQHQLGSKIQVKPRMESHHQNTTNQWHWQCYYIILDGMARKKENKNRQRLVNRQRTTLRLSSRVPNLKWER